MDHATEKTELRELTDVEIENISGGNLALTFCAIALFTIGVGHGIILARQ